MLIVRPTSWIFKSLVVILSDDAVCIRWWLGSQGFIEDL